MSLMSEDMVYLLAKKVAKPARISVKKNEPFLSFGCALLVSAIQNIY